MARALNESHATMPWDIHPALTADRLAVCARLLASARRDALAMASYELGDDPWSVGCRAYSFGRRRLARAAQSGQHNWLGILDDTHHFVFLIEDVPVRFYRGPAEEPSSRTLRRAQDEANQLTLALGVVAKNVVPGDAADGWFSVECGVWPGCVVGVQPGMHGLGSLCR